MVRLLLFWGLWKPLVGILHSSFATACHATVKKCESAP